MKEWFGGFFSLDVLDVSKIINYIFDFFSKKDENWIFNTQRPGKTENRTDEQGNHSTIIR